MRPVSAGARERLKTWDGHVADPRDAASVLVCRERAGSLEVLLLRRQQSMKFAAGMHVFPGGSVQPSDREPVPWLGPAAEFWAQCWGCVPELARALVVAAVRETFEETGILIAGPDGESVLGACAGPDWSSARRALEAGELTLGGLLADRRLVLRADLLGAWAHWVTPEFEPRRFDTRFFVAVLPAGDADHTHGPEADASFWIETGAALESADSGRLEMMAPTRRNLRALQSAGRSGAEAVVSAAEARRVPTVAPRLVEVDGQHWLTSGDDAEPA